VNLEAVAHVHAAALVEFVAPIQEEAVKKAIGEMAIRILPNTFDLDVERISPVVARANIDHKCGTEFSSIRMDFPITCSPPRVSFSSGL
jgi:hypothetical protein